MMFTWGMTEILDLKVFKSTVDISTPSMSIFPPAASTIRNKLNVSEDLPAPVRPTIPTYTKQFHVPYFTINFYLEPTFWESCLLFLHFLFLETALVKLNPVLLCIELWNRRKQSHLFEAKMKKFSRALQNPSFPINDMIKFCY